MDLRQARERTPGELTWPGLLRKHKAKAVVENPRKELMEEDVLEEELMEEDSPPYRYLKAK